MREYSNVTTLPAVLETKRESEQVLSSDVMTVGWVKHRVRQSVCDTHSSMSTIPRSPRASLSTRICTCHVAACILDETTVRWFYANLFRKYILVFVCCKVGTYYQSLGLDVQFHIKRISTNYNSVLKISFLRLLEELIEKLPLF